MKKVYENGDIYEGGATLFTRKRQGNGKMIYKYRGTYEGEWKDDKRHGYGVMHYSNKNEYKGEWEEDFPWGEGEMQYANGDKFVGRFFRGERLSGELTTQDARYIGEYRYDKLTNGKVIGKDYEYEGQMSGLYFHGFGEIKYADGQSYKGYFTWGEKSSQGYVTEYLPNGCKYIGWIKDHQYDGTGTLVTKDGIECEGTFVKGMLDGEYEVTFSQRDKRKVVFNHIPVSKAESALIAERDGKSVVLGTAEATPVTQNASGVKKAVASLGRRGVDGEKQKEIEKYDTLYEKLNTEIIIATKAAKEAEDFAKNPKKVENVSSATCEENAQKAKEYAQRAQGNVEKFLSLQKENTGSLKAISPFGVEHKIFNTNTGSYDTYKGDLVGSQKHGYGQYMGKDFTYEGQYKNDKKHGLGFLKFGEQVNYIGEFFEDHIQGYGVLTASDGVRKGLYEKDEFRMGLFEGTKGKYYGGFKNGGFDGRAIIETADVKLGFRFFGNKICSYGYCKKKDIDFYGYYDSEKQKGTGAIFNKAGKRLYEGEVSNLIADGVGREFLSTGEIVEGNFQNGGANGYCYVINGGTKRRARFEEGKLIEFLD
ncbi:MAG: hypothetical protein J6B45_01285 [Clostridia bacterium]|nr:hypothetical protein [Clostridia bacterium]